MIPTDRWYEVHIYYYNNMTASCGQEYYSGGRITFRWNIWNSVNFNILHSILSIGKDKWAPKDNCTQNVCQHTYKHAHHTLFKMLYTQKQKQNLVYVCFNFQHSCTTPKRQKLKYKQMGYCTWLQLPTVHVHKDKQKQITFDSLLNICFIKINSSAKVR